MGAGILDAYLCVEAASIKQSQTQKSPRCQSIVPRIIRLHGDADAALCLDHASVFTIQTCWDRVDRAEVHRRALINCWNTFDTDQVYA